MANCLHLLHHLIIDDCLSPSNTYYYGWLCVSIWYTSVWLTFSIYHITSSWKIMCLHLRHVTKANCLHLIHHVTMAECASSSNTRHYGWLSPSIASRHAESSLICSRWPKQSRDRIVLNWRIKRVLAIKLCADRKVWISTSQISPSPILYHDCREVDPPQQSI